MASSRTDSWSRLRQSFADQFEPRGDDFLYRRSQKGAGFKVSAAERDRFIESFDSHLSRARWIIGIGLAIIVVAVGSLSVVQHSAPPRGIILAGTGLAMIPYLAYYRWAWAEPARELASRIPVAGERSPEEIQRLRFQRTTYGQLASAAVGGLVIPFVGLSRGDLFSGWNRLWLLFGGAIVLLAAVQAFRKWQFEHENFLEVGSPPLSRQDIAQPPDPFGWLENGQLARYLPIAVIVVALALVFLTPAGREAAKSPLFWPIAVVCLGLWPLFTVARGYSRGFIEPFARGFYNTYERETQPKRFWVSMGWNALVGVFFLWAGLMGIKDGPEQALSSTCDDFHAAPQDQLAACNELLGKKDWSGDERARLLYARGSANYRLRGYRQALADYTEVMRLEPSDPISRYARGLTDERLGDRTRAVVDYGEAIKLRPDYYEAHFARGLVFLDSGRFDEAVADFTRAHELRPTDPWPVANRGIGYAWKRDPQDAERDFVAVRKADPSNPVVLRGEALLSMNAGDMPAAIASLTAALKLDPDDTWSLGMRAEAYRRTGEIEKARADGSRLARLIGPITVQASPS